MFLQVAQTMSSTFPNYKHCCILNKCRIYYENIQILSTMPFFNQRHFIFHTIRQVNQMLTHCTSIRSRDINGLVFLFMAYYFTIYPEFPIQLFNYLNIFFFSKSHCSLNNFVIFLQRSIISYTITQAYGNQMISNLTLFICFFAIANKQIVNFIKGRVSNNAKAITFNNTSGVGSFSNFWDVPIRFFIVRPAFVKFKQMVQVVFMYPTLLQFYFRAFCFRCILTSISQPVSNCHFKKIRWQCSSTLTINYMIIHVLPVMWRNYIKICIFIIQS